MDRKSFLPVAVPVAAATFATMLGIGMLVPALPHLTADAGGAFAAGALVSSFGVARLLTNLPAGIMADRMGIAPTAIVGLMILAAGAAAGGVDLGLPMLVLSLFLQGVGSAIFSTTAMTALVLAAGPERRGAAMAWFQGALLLAMGIGPVLGGFLVDRFGATSPFVVEAVLAFLALGAAVVLPQGGAATRPGARPSGRSYLTASLVAGAAMGFAAFFARVGAGWNVVPAVATGDLALTSSHLGWIVGVATLANFLTQPIAARLIDGWGAERTTVAAAAIALAGLALMTVVETVPVLWAGTVLLMTATGAMIPAAGAVALKGAPREATGRVMGLFRTATDLAMTLGPIAIPAATAGLGLPIVDGFAVAAAVLAVCVLAGAAVRARAVALAEAAAG
ncbi:MFS transporter [Oharaeibacter diazotrophicus]|nr:MFS transporter [Oharaeibacter diazotrophicus]GLS76259.1 hypothetical protein GCM10007904_15940 [Oharaeibacter diazotrophicus]